MYDGEGCRNLWIEHQTRCNTNYSPQRKDGISMALVNTMDDKLVKV